MKKFDTVDNYYILAFAYRVYNAKWQNIILNLDNDVEEERLSRICFQLMFAMDSYYEKGLITLTAISDYEIYNRLDDVFYKRYCTIKRTLQIRKETVKISM